MGETDYTKLKNLLEDWGVGFTTYSVPPEYKGTEFEELVIHIKNVCVDFYFDVEGKFEEIGVDA